MLRNYRTRRLLKKLSRSRDSKSLSNSIESLLHLSFDKESLASILKDEFLDNSCLFMNDLIIICAGKHFLSLSSDPDASTIVKNRFRRDMVRFDQDKYAVAMIDVFGYPDPIPQNTSLLVDLFVSLEVGRNDVRRHRYDTYRSKIESLLTPLWPTAIDQLQKVLENVEISGKPRSLRTLKENGGEKVVNKWIDDILVRLKKGAENLERRINEGVTIEGYSMESSSWLKLDRELERARYQLRDIGDPMIIPSLRHIIEGLPYNVRTKDATSLFFSNEQTEEYPLRKELRKLIKEIEERNV